MKAVDAILNEDEEAEDHVYFSDEEEDKISLASDLDSDDMEEVEQKEMEMEKKPKKKYRITSCLVSVSVYVPSCLWNISGHFRSPH